MYELSGVLKESAIEGSTARIVAIGPEGSVLAEVQPGKNGAWAFDSPLTPEWVLAIASGRRIAAASARTRDWKELQFPPLATLRFEFPEAPPGSVLWIDPIELEGLPPELIGSLRLHANQTIDLHLGEIPAAQVQDFQAQRGVYRISGGRLSIRPVASMEAGAFILDQLINRKTGAVHAASNGEVVIPVHDSGGYTVLFSAQP